MELKIWSKTFLNAYRSLEKIVSAIDKIVLTSGLNSNMDVYYSASKIIELTDRKITLINLKLLIEDCLASLNCDDAKLLMLKYVDRVKSEDIAKVLDISTRTFFRRSNSSIKSFELALKGKNYSHKELKTMLSKEIWIMDLYNKLYKDEILSERNKASKQKNNALKAEKEFDENKLLNLAYNSYKKLEPALYY
ncbi:MAG: hypothetical protein AB7S44_00595 [Spirochaetales bacterium]